MKKKQLMVSAPTEFARALSGAVRVGQVLDLDTAGQPIVDYPGNPGAPLPARVLSSAFADVAAQTCVGLSVLLVFENGDTRLPIVVGQLASGLPLANQQTATLLRDVHDDVAVNGRKLQVTGRESIAIQCGKSSIELHADGRVVIKGTRLVSRASESNKIKGAVVNVN